MRHSDERRGGAGRLRIRQKIMSVPLRCLDRDEDFARPKLATIEIESSERAGRMRRPSASGPSCELIWRKRDHVILRLQFHRLHSDQLPRDLPIIERKDGVRKFLVAFVAFARNQHTVARLRDIQRE